MRVVEDALLKDYNTFGVSAKARFLVHIEHAEDYAAALAFAHRHRLGCERDTLVLGCGSNVLLTRDYDGVVLHVATKGRSIVASADAQVIVEAEAGELWHPFMMWTLEQCAYGLENLALIPGTVGAAPVQNIGAYGAELSQWFEALWAIDLKSGQTHELRASQCGFAYRDSVFKRAEGANLLITRVQFRLSTLPRVNTAYGDIQAQLQAQGVVDPKPHDVASTVIAIRSRKLPDPALLGNAGSFFTNPNLSQAQWQALRARSQLVPPSFPVSDGGVKVPAAWLIEQCGLKGFRSGDAGVHAQHALVLVNYGNASGQELLALADHVQSTVMQRFGITLHPEPRVL